MILLVLELIRTCLESLHLGIFHRLLLQGVVYALQGAEIRSF